MQNKSMQKHYALRWHWNKGRLPLRRCGMVTKWQDSFGSNAPCRRSNILCKTQLQKQHIF